METKKTIYELHEDHKTWQNKLSFYRDEIKIMQNRISEIAAKNTAKEVLAFVEHFQNQLIIQDEQTDILSHDIKKREAVLEAAANRNKVAVDHEKFEDDPLLRSQMDDFERLFNDLRKELITFLSKWM